MWSNPFCSIDFFPQVGPFLSNLIQVLLNASLFSYTIVRRNYRDALFYSMGPWNWKVTTILLRHDFMGLR